MTFNILPYFRRFYIISFLLCLQRKTVKNFTIFYGFSTILTGFFSLKSFLFLTFQQLCPDISLILILLLYIFRKIYNLKFVLECWAEADVVVGISRIVVIALRGWIVRACIVVIASPVGTRIVAVGSFRFIPNFVFIYIINFYLSFYVFSI